MIGELISNYGEIGFAGIIIILMVWLVRYLVKQSTDDKLYYRKLISNDMKGLHSDSVKNAELNSQSLILQKDMAKQLEKHNGHSKKAWDKTIDSLTIICDKLNGENSAMIKVKKELGKHKVKA